MSSAQSRLDLVGKGVPHGDPHHAVHCPAVCDHQSLPHLGLKAGGEGEGCRVEGTRGWVRRQPEGELPFHVYCCHLRSS